MIVSLFTLFGVLIIPDVVRPRAYQPCVPDLAWPGPLSLLACNGCLHWGCKCVQPRLLSFGALQAAWDGASVSPPPPPQVREGADLVSRLQTENLWVVVLEKMRKGLG